MAILVSANRWPYTVPIPKDPNDVLDYQLDCSDWLMTGETITDSTVTVSGLTLSTSAVADTTVTAWVSGGTVGVDGSITFHVTTNSAPISRQIDRTLIVKIVER
jgi:hypothetical protein